MSEHTPGPWFVRRDKRRAARQEIGAGHQGICDVFWSMAANDTEGNANARLIAAAPETAAERDRLREALRIARREYERMAETGVGLMRELGRECDDASQMVAYFDKITDYAALATGEQKEDGG